MTDNDQQRKPRYAGVALVRGPDGHVKYNDPHNVPQAIIDVLSEGDLEHLEKLKQETPTNA